MHKPQSPMSGARLPSAARQIRRLAGERSFWILATMFVGLTFLHYLRPQLGLASVGFVERHAMERVVFLLPVALATFLYGQNGGLVALLFSILVMLPRVFLISAFPGDALLETLAVGLVGYLVIWIIDAQEREKQLRQEAIARLKAINLISTSVTQSLELEEILNNALTQVLEATQLTLGSIFLIDRVTNDLVLSVYKGLSEEQAGALKRQPTSRGLAGWVARMGKPRGVKGVPGEQEWTSSIFIEAGAKSLLAAPLMSRGRFMGVIELADPRPGRFSADDMELLTSVGNAIGVAVENAYLCHSIRHYARQVTRAQEDERARIARELHDDTIQSLIVLARRIEAMAQGKEKGAPVATHQLRELQTLADDIIQGVRRFSRDLRPSTLDDLGLLPTLEGLAAGITEKDGIPTQFFVTGEKRRLPTETELVLFRIAQEALNNVKKHAQAQTASITVKFTPEMVEMVVQDNGKGFASADSVEELAVAGHLGLIGMRERARLLGGDLNIQTQPGRGTKVIITAPAPPTGLDRAQSSNTKVVRTPDSRRWAAR